MEVRIDGRVQGVFFRGSCQREADRLGVTGWATNEPDGSVVVWAEGSPEAVAALVAWCRRGPARAQVLSVDQERREPRGETRFRVR